MLQGMPEVEDFATPLQKGGASPDPFGAVADHHHHRLGSQPTPLPQLRPEVAKNDVGFSPASHPEATHEGVATQGSLHPFAEQQQDTEAEAEKE